MSTIPQCDTVLAEYINTVVCEDGYSLCYRFWPTSGSTAGTMILVNGMMSHSGWFRELAHLLTGLQLDVVGADRRGSGLNQAARGDAPSRQMLLSDLRRIIENEDRGLPIYLVGWCWGALPVVNLALELGSKLRGLVLLAPGLFPSPEVKRAAEEQLIAWHNADPHCLVLRSPLTAEMFSERAKVREFILNDDLAQRIFTPRFFCVTGEMSLIATVRLPRLTQPLLVLLAGNDVTADNERTLRAFQRLARGSLTTATLACHHGMPFEVPREIVMRISQWLPPSSGVENRPI
jgi:alpha-beta hydrolase superfamily lysophospholipase